MTASRVDTVADAERRDLVRGLGGAAIAVCAWSTGTVLVKYIDMGGLALGAYRFALFSIGIVVWMEVRGTPFRWRAFRASMWGGIALGGDIALFFSAVKLTSVVNATIIGSLQPIVVGVVAARFFGEQIKRRDALWSLVALAGVFVVVTAGSGSDDSSWKGDLLAFGAMATWSAYFIFSKRSAGTITSTEFTAGSAVWSALICTPLAFLFGQDMSLPAAKSWFWLIVMAISAGVIGHTLMNWSLVRIPLWIGSTFTLLIPVFSAILAWIFLGEAISPAQAAAMAVVVGALAAIVHDQRHHPAAEIAAEEVVA